ncbi:hypothetical protein Y695_02235 [Hydrogenophaga sp. T4]|nr:hypothetical protein Y695_02235 [Hydrogenophaga sp. T4]
MGWSALYQAKGCNYVVNDFAGVRGEPEHTVELPFTERPDGSFAATVYLDAMLDEDYYGNGVCQWTLAGVGAGARQAVHRKKPRSTAILTSNICWLKNRVRCSIGKVPTALLCASQMRRFRSRRWRLGRLTAANSNRHFRQSSFH